MTASYADIVSKYQEERDAGHYVTKPLCLVPAFYEAYTQAKQTHLRTQALESSITNVDKPKRRMNSMGPAEEARRAMEEAEKRLSDVSLYLHFRVPSGPDHDRINAAIDKKLKITKQEKRDAAWNVAWLVEVFDHATNVSGETIEDFTSKVAQDELSKLPTPILNDMINSVGRAMSMPDFPTLQM